MGQELQPATAAASICLIFDCVAIAALATDRVGHSRQADYRANQADMKGYCPWCYCFCSSGGYSCTGKTTSTLR